MAAAVVGIEEEDCKCCGFAPSWSTGAEEILMKDSTKTFLTVLAGVCIFGGVLSLGPKEGVLSLVPKKIAPIAAPVAAPAPVALSTDEILACDRRSVLYDPAAHKIAEQSPSSETRTAVMKPGDEGWIVGLTSSKGHVFVNMFDKAVPKPDSVHTVMVRRVTEGFLVDCNSPELWVYLDDNRDPGDLIPVVGHLQVKPTKLKLVQQ